MTEGNDIRQERIDDVLAGYKLRVREEREEPEKELLARHSDLAPELGRELYRKLDAWRELTILALEVRTGRVLDDRFEVGAPAGHGATSNVFKAVDRETGELVALKVLQARRANLKVARRFETEAAAMKLISNRSVVRILAIGRKVQTRGSASGHPPYLAMEWIPGGSLKERLTAVEPSGAVPRGLDVRTACRLALAVARAMEDAHRCGVVHRDLKPANILLRENGSPVVTDFGLATVLGEAHHTVSEAVLGTLSYLAPEQALGRQRIGVRTDVWLLGASLFEMLTLRGPNDHANGQPRDLPEILALHRSRNPVPRLGDVHAEAKGDLELVVGKALRMEPWQRYRSMRKFGDDLQRYLDGERVRARQESGFERLMRRALQNPPATGAAVVAFLVALFWAGSGVLSSVRQQAEETATRTSEWLSEAQSAVRGEMPEIGVLPLLLAIREAPSVDFVAERALADASILRERGHPLLSRLIAREILQRSPQAATSRRIHLEDARAALERLDFDGALAGFEAAAREGAGVEAARGAELVRALNPIGLALRADQIAPRAEITAIAWLDLDSDGCDDLVAAIADGERSRMLRLSVAGDGSWSSPRDCADVDWRGRPLRNVRSLVPVQPRVGPRPALLACAPAGGRGTVALLEWDGARFEVRWQLSPDRVGAQNAWVADLDADGQPEALVRGELNDRGLALIDGLESAEPRVADDALSSLVGASDTEDVGDVAFVAIPGEDTPAVAIATRGHRRFELVVGRVTGGGFERMLPPLCGGALSGVVAMDWPRAGGPTFLVARGFAPSRPDLEPRLHRSMRDGTVGLFRANWTGADWDVTPLHPIDPMRAEWMQCSGLHTWDVTGEGIRWCASAVETRRGAYFASRWSGLLLASCSAQPPDSAWLPLHGQLSIGEGDGTPGDEIAMLLAGGVLVLGLDGAAATPRQELVEHGFLDVTRLDCDDAFAALAASGTGAEPGGASFGAICAVLDSWVERGRFRAARALVDSWGGSEELALRSQIDLLAGRLEELDPARFAVGKHRLARIRCCDPGSLIRRRNALRDKTSPAAVVVNEGFGEIASGAGQLESREGELARRADGGRRGGVYGRGDCGVMAMTPGGSASVVPVTLVSRESIWDGVSPFALSFDLFVHHLDFDAAFRVALVVEGDIDGFLYPRLDRDASIEFRLIHQRDSTRRNGDRYEAALRCRSPWGGRWAFEPAETEPVFPVGEWARVDLEWEPDTGITRLHWRRVARPESDGLSFTIHGLEPCPSAGLAGTHRLVLTLSTLDGQRATSNPPAPCLEAELMLDEIVLTTAAR